MQAIQKRIESIRVTRQISQAMRLVSNTKIQRAMRQVEAVRPFTQETQRLARTAAASLFETRSLYTEQRPLQKTVYVVLGSDRGLCGGYNINIGKEGLAALKEGEDEGAVVAVGAKMRDYFTRRRVPILHYYGGISQNPFYADAHEMGDLLLDLYRKDEVQRVVLVYTHFASILNHVPTREVLLPLPPPAAPAVPGGEGAEESGPAPLLRMEPGEEALLDRLVPGYLYASLFGALAQGAACEQSARITSMDAAVRNSTDIIDELQTAYNQARQAAITQDLNEIVSGAEALR